MSRLRLSIAVVLMAGGIPTTLGHAESPLKDGYSLLESMALGITANDLTIEQRLKKLAFMSYVQGVIDGQLTTRAFHGENMPRVRAFCLPEEMKVGGAIDAVERFLSHASVYGTGSLDPREFLELPASLVVFAALLETFGCDDRGDG